MNKKKSYLIIILYGILLTFLLVGTNNLYGSNTDWINQHSVIPEYFRSSFYETKNLIPDFAFNLGAGQNIFNYGYYGLLSPVILVSYLLPFISMTNYIMIASVILYLLSGVLLYKFLSSHFNDKTSLLLSLCFLTLSPLTFHFHRHIMFVWYMPFLILSLIGVDKYVGKNKSVLLMVGIFLNIMTNYYYGVSCLIVVLIYGIYRLINKYDKFCVKTFILDVLKASLRIIAPILLACVILIPNLYVILNSNRMTNASVSTLELIIPNLNEVLYRSYTMGITTLFIMAPIGLIISKKKQKGDTFLSIALLLITFIPFFMYGLNGFLYVRGKVLIPFTVLFVFVLAKFIERLKSESINIKKLILITTIILLVSFLFDYKNVFYVLVLFDLIVTIGCLFAFNKCKKEKIILVPLLIILLVTAFLNNLNEDYVSKDEYANIENKSVSYLLNQVDDSSFYRTDNYVMSSVNVNKSYNENYYNTTIYSSNYNNYYWRFYNFEVGNNIPYRNAFLTAGSQNLLFNNLMGVKYVITADEMGPGYKKINEKDGVSLYYNNNAFPLVYVTDNVGSYEVYNKLDFPYSTEYMLSNPVVNAKEEDNYKSGMQKLDLGLEDHYEFTVSKDESYEFDLKQTIKDKILIVTFDMNYNESCLNGDTKITINGITNKLTCKSWLYHNENNSFEYVISNFDEISKLKVDISKGRYEISNINVYLMDYNFKKYSSINNLKIDKKRSEITGVTKTNNDSYVITSIPYDEGFSVYVDDKKVDYELVNSAFLGFKVDKGTHNIKIVYHSPGLNYGVLLSVLGFLLMIFILIYEIKEKMIKKLFLKHRELIMYLIFGFLTTVISVGVYWFCVFTFLDATNAFELQVANVISWILSVLFAYVTNRKFVFESKNDKIVKEVLSFYSSRVLTLLIDMLLMFVFVSVLKYNDTVVKLFVQVVIVILNYVLSKLLVFKKERK